MKNKLLIGLLLTAQVNGALGKGLTGTALQEHQALLKKGSDTIVRQTQNLFLDLVNDTIKVPKEEIASQVNNFKALHARLQDRLNGLLDKAETQYSAIESTIEKQYSTLQDSLDKARATYIKYRTNSAKRAAALSEYKAAFQKFNDFKKANDFLF
jgi:hypothetical protein